RGDLFPTGCWYRRLHPGSVHLPSASGAVGRVLYPLTDRRFRIPSRCAKVVLGAEEIWRKRPITNMKALLLSEYRHLEITDVPAPTVAPDEVLIRVVACGICGSDVHGYDGSSGRRIPPIVMGHEAAGQIAAVGSSVKNLAEGDRVTFDSTVYCGECKHCRAGNINLCDRRQVLGVSCGDYRRAGAFAEYVAVPSRIIHRLPDSFPFAEAAMLEAVAVAIHGVNLAQLKPGATALVIGAGTIGLLTQQALRASGCERVII